MTSKFSSRLRGLHLIKKIAGKTEFQHFDTATRSWIARSGQLGFILSERVEGEVVLCKFYISRELVGVGEFDFRTGEKLQVLRISKRKYEESKRQEELEKSLNIVGNHLVGIKTIIQEIEQLS
ncbi:hypothetical protein J6TS7_21010 [Paenibacillus dendritiformis]|uniref:hypothetical protein n=1 Tax=Paenibacillus TaxID=44249 RepID=UPI001B1CB596|nr:hypothetical protein [Paenibacillus dendritiformis]GIO78491.1 hypothetical protein J6TS7_21010 [Paenibacillus dendritiformis]